LGAAIVAARIGRTGASGMNALSHLSFSYHGLTSPVTETWFFKSPWSNRSREWRSSPAPA
jgi:hypothetical protein